MTAREAADQLAALIALYIDQEQGYTLGRDIGLEELGGALTAYHRAVKNETETG